jgi:hypothetical protein
MGMPDHDHSEADAGDPECPCYVAGWNFGYEAGEAAASDEEPEEEAEAIRARLLQAVQDLHDGRITAAEANRITKEAGQEIRKVETALRVARLARKIGPTD